jgi:hypothetical protein
MKRTVSLRFMRSRRQASEARPAAGFRRPCPASAFAAASRSVTLVAEAARRETEAARGPPPTPSGASRYGG